MGILSLCAEISRTVSRREKVNRSPGVRWLAYDRTAWLAQTTLVVRLETGICPAYKCYA
jgi:hypothetical protein